MANNDTAWQILNAAEELFYEKGFAETSLRTITTKAGVNLAAVNYHFGSKKELIQAVFDRFLKPFCVDLSYQLDEYQKKSRDCDVVIEEFFSLLSKTIANMGRENPKRVRVFMRLLGLAYAQGQGHLKRFLKQEYGAVFSRCADLIREMTPHLSDEERFWRLHFAIGASVFTLSSAGHLSAMVEHDFGKETRIHEVIHSLLPFLTSGMQAPPVILDA